MPRHEHPRLEEVAPAAELCPPEDVLERFAAGPPLDHRPDRPEVVARLVQQACLGLGEHAAGGAQPLYGSRPIALAVHGTSVGV